MPRPAALRELSRRYKQEAKSEIDPHLRQSLASHAFALAQLAEKIEGELAENLRGADLIS